MTLPGPLFESGRPQAIDNRERTSPAARLTGLLIALFAAAPLGAVGLGDIELGSHLNQPLEATIQVIGESGGGDISVWLGDGEAYRRLGLTRPRMLDRVQVLIETTATGRRVRITGQTPVTDLILDLVLILADGDSEQTRHYPVLLDFSSADAPPPGALRRSDPEPVTARPAQPTGRRAVPTGKSYGPVQPGDTLSGIASLIRGNQPVRHWALVEALHELNPDAFIDGDMDRLKVGAVLQIPSLDGLAATTIRRAPPASTAPGMRRQATPRSEDGALTPPQARDPGQRAADSRLEIIGTPNSAQILESMNELLERDDEQLAAQGTEARRQLAFATAEIQTYRNENEQLRRQVRDLETRVANLNRLIELRASAGSGDARSPVAAAAPDADVAAPDAGPGSAERPGASADEDDRLTLAGRSPAARDEARRPWYTGWVPWALALLTLLGVAILLWLRGRREELRRKERTADLVNRIRQAADRGSP